MLVRISGETKNYPWGSSHLIQDHLGLGSSGQPLAEVWFGTHPQGQSKVLSSGKTLSEQLGSRLSFLVKFLAADKPLSIQAHPNAAQAKAGFDRENSAGLALDDPTRNYKDDSAKPELLIALSEFRALCGFRPTAEILEIFLAFSETEPRFGELAALVATDSSLETLLAELLQDTELAKRFDSTVVSIQDDSLAESARALASQLLSQYPGDTGALVALVLNLVELSPGEAIYLPAGNLHAYLSGLGIEVMAASDNVIRAGLTQKHIDKNELLNIAAFQSFLEPVMLPRKLAEGLSEYEVAAEQFRVYKADVTGTNLLADLDLPGSALVVCVSGEVAVSTSLEEREVLRKAEVVYLSDAKKFSLSGSGSVFVVLGSNS